MAVSRGDIRNNYEKLKQELKQVQYTAVNQLEIATTTDPNDKGSVVSQQDLLMKGIPLAFLPLIHHCLLEYSPLVADFTRASGFDLFAKNDFRFIESAFKLLVNTFGYRPTISVHQFFQDGFAEQKIILCKDIASLVKQKHKELQK